MKCTKCKGNLRCIRCGATVPDDLAAGPGSRPLARSISEELHNRSVCVEVSKGVLRNVLLLSDVEEILAQVLQNSAATP